MISLRDFEEQMETLSHLCGFIVKRVAVQSYFDAIKHEKKENLAEGLRLMTEDPPSKLTLKALRYFISKTKTIESKPMWDGTPCRDDRCIDGLITEIFNGYHYSFRCGKCNSNSLKILPFHSEENVGIAEEHAKRIYTNSTM